MLVEEKIRMFDSMLTDEAARTCEKEYEKEISLLEDEKKLVISDIDHKKEQVMKDLDLVVKYEEKSLVLSAQSALTKEKMQRRQGYTNEIMRLLREKILIMDKDEYEDYLRKSLLIIEEKFSDQRHIVLKVNSKDMQKTQALIDELSNKKKLNKKYHIEVGNIGILGGIVAESQDRILRIDLSLEGKLKDNMEYLTSIIFARLNKVV